MQKKRPIKNTQAYVFKVTLDLDSPKMWQGKVNQQIRKSKKAPWRRIVILGNQSLYDFAEAINEAFGFMFDHCFGFYSNLEDRKMYKSENNTHHLNKSLLKILIK